MRLGRTHWPLRMVGAAAALLVAAACGSGGPTAPRPGGSVTVTAITPSTGSTFGGTTVTITGTGFAGGATVQIGTATATNVVVVNDTTLTATTAPNAAGTADVRVTVGGSLGSLAGAFTFVTPTVGPNTPPTVGAMQVTHARANQPSTLATIGDRVSLTVAVSDAETPVADLTYEWAANPVLGTFIGSGPSVEWQAPASTTSPQSAELMLTVIDRYLEPDPQGLPIQREHRVQRSTPIKVHDTPKEVTDMAVDFWKLFADSSITSPEAVLHNFSKTCDGGSGYEQEYGDIVDNRLHVEIIEYTPIQPTVFEYAFGSRQACSRKQGTPGDVCVEVPVKLRDRVKATGEERDVAGTGYVTGVYEGDLRWRLCHSRWTGADTATGNPVILDVTGRGGIIRGPRDK